MAVEHLYFDEDIPQEVEGILAGWAIRCIPLWK